MTIFTYIFGFFATFMGFTALNYKVDPGKEMSMPTIVISCIVWPITLGIGLVAGAVNGFISVYRNFRK
jgi:hypothetical protein